MVVLCSTKVELKNEAFEGDGINCINIVVIMRNNSKEGKDHDHCECLKLKKCFWSTLCELLSR